MLGPHILGSHFVTFFMSMEIAAQSSRRRGSSMVSRYSSTLASVCFVFSSAMELRGVSSQLLLPILFQHQLIYPVGVKHLMHQHVPEHYIHRVVAERLMLGRPLPILCG